MGQIMEYECKNMLSKEQFESICLFFKLNRDSFSCQINDYFDTPTLGLRAQQAALRIRHADGKHDLTLKQRQGCGVIETHQWLTDAECSDMLRFGTVPSGEVEQAVTKLSVNVDTLVALGRLKTERCQFPYVNGELFLDHSFYLKQEDYEIEFERPDAEASTTAFADLLHRFAIGRRPAENKIARLFAALQKKPKQTDM
ncbi:MAG: CYTH domain-containing protein [Sporolactobacillus sp.]